MFEEKENFDGEKKIAEMLSSLKRVDAPGDFNAHVRARIARGQSLSTNSSAPNLSRIGASVAAAIVLVVGGYFVFTSINTGQNDATTVAETWPAQPQPNIEPPASNSQADDTASQTVEGSGSEARADNESPNTSGEAPRRGATSGPNVNSESDRPGGSVDSAAPAAPKPIRPPGFDPDSKVPTSATGVDPNARTNISSIFNVIGIKASWTKGGWRVNSVSANNIAERSGIRAGDVIEAINGERVGERTTFAARFDGKSVRVRRDGASVEIAFKP